MKRRRALRVEVRAFALAAMLGYLITVLAGAQSDMVSFDSEAALLRYEINYERAAAVAERLECPQTALENGLLHSALRYIFLFLPLEASYYDAVKMVEVDVVRRAEDDIETVLQLRAPLSEIRATNSLFRVFMNGFASPKAGFCFAVDAETLQVWLDTFRARGGQIAYNPDVFVELETLVRVEAASFVPLASEVTAGGEASGTSVDASGAAAAARFQAVPYLSELPVRDFAAPLEVLEPATDYAAVVVTTQGAFMLDLFEDLAPRTVNNFVFLARNRFFDGLAFHRVLEGFIAQAGDPLGTGLGGPGYTIADEIVTGLSHSVPGVVSMANASPDTAGSQFFVTLAPAPSLDGHYSIFGLVTDGLAVLESLQRVDPSAPVAVATLDTTVGLLALQGVALGVEDSTTLSDYLLESLGALPEGGQRLTVGDYDLSLGSDPQTGGEVVAFWPTATRIVEVQIFAKPK